MYVWQNCVTICVKFSRVTLFFFQSFTDCWDNMQVALQLGQLILSTREFFLECIALNSFTYHRNIKAELI